jgi:hypothetical protein
VTNLLVRSSSHRLGAYSSLRPPPLIKPPLHGSTEIQRTRGERLPNKQIYCILCPSYHGSTLLSLSLGNHSRVFAPGDTLPSKHSLPHTCGCGELFGACSFWNRVSEVCGQGEGEFVPSRPSFVRWPRLDQAIVLCTGAAAVFFGTTFRPQSFAAAFEGYLSVCDQVADFDIFIDGYKSISHYLALKASGFPVRGVIHLLRDPRAFAASAKRVGVDAAHSARQWSRLHTGIAAITRGLGENVIRVKYEDLCAAANHELGHLQAWMKLREECLVRPLDRGRHWIGNMSMCGFTGEFRINVGWERTLEPQERRQVEALTRNCAGRFGYHFPS